MHILAAFYRDGVECEKNEIKAFELEEKAVINGYQSGRV